MQCRNWLVKSLIAAGLVCVSVPTAQAGIVISFTDQTWTGFNFSDFSDTLWPQGVVGTLTAVSVNATLTASTEFTYADDLAVYVDPAPLSTGGLLQVGGFSSLSATERRFWANGGSDAPGTVVNDTVVLNNALTFAGTAADPLIWIGNGYGAAGTSGTWTGSVTLVGINAVPEPSALLLTCAGLSAAALVRRRRK